MTEDERLCNYGINGLNRRVSNGGCTYENCGPRQEDERTLMGGQMNQRMRGETRRDDPSIGG